MRVRAGRVHDHEEGEMSEKRGTCPHCGERFVLRADGLLRHHTGTGRHALPSGAWAHCCPGCGEPPVDPARAAALRGPHA